MKKVTYEAVLEEMVKRDSKAWMKELIEASGRDMFFCEFTDRPHMEVSDNSIDYEVNGILFHDYDENGATCTSISIVGCIFESGIIYRRYIEDRDGTLIWASWFEKEEGRRFCYPA